MGEVLGWGVIGIMLAVPVIFLWISISARHGRDRFDGGAPTSGGLLGMDEIFHPAAHNARLEWEAVQEVPVPAPTPDRGPGVIEADGRIVIEIPGATGASARPVVADHSRPTRRRA